MKKPKIILWDTEVSTALVKGYGPKWDFKCVEEVRPQQLMCYSWKELDARATHFVSMHDFDTYKEFIQSLADLLDEADISIAHNGIHFDDKMANTFFITQGVDRPSMRKSVDTCRVARSKFRFSSNKLDDLGTFLGVGEKVSISLIGIEDDFLDGKRQAIRDMKRYNVQDVILLEKIYKKLLPYIDNHPNIGMYARQEGICSHCGSINLQKRGIKPRGTGLVQWYFCNDCRGWSTDRVVTRDGGTHTTVSGQGS